MYELKEFLFMGKKLRVVIVDDQTFYFVASDTCKLLGLSGGSVRHRVLATVPEKERVKLLDLLHRTNDSILTVTKSNTNGQMWGKLNWQAVLITEAGLYRLVMRSNKPEAKNFQDWVFGDVLPTLHRTGTYTIPGMENTPILTAAPQEAHTSTLIEQNNLHFEITVKADNGASLHISKVIRSDTDSQALSTMWRNIVETVNNIL